MENNMSMKEAFIAYWTKGFTFTGRARRSEFWLNVLVNAFAFILGCLLFLFIDSITSFRFHLGDHFQFFCREIFPYITLIPGMAQASRRLHDINMNGKIAIYITVISSILGFISKRFFDFDTLNFEGGSVFLVALSLIMSLGGLFLFICNFIRGNEGSNKYGDDPKLKNYVSEVE